ncbi:DUF262 domain-containing protein [Vacuolonema iberomarrocanum]|uniref:DUF262 domain-containing protein n=1 Tax=Vacuolonema iberomarrocanum TaxID=3454632 RepID=UPI001A01FB0A|nr:DUF262 domain-containing protein [filamentous cyanobacterium LEGE 07170]
MVKIGIATNKKLLELFNMMKGGSLILAPNFQRKLVWNDKHKEDFIETILLSLPFPEIYLADGGINLDTQTSETLVVDGQQRLSTIFQYITASPEFVIKSLPKFADLTPEQKTDFYDYNIVIRDLGRIEEDTIRDIFKRINSVNYALNAVEIRNALYEGEFIQAAKTILESNEISTEDNVFSSVFSDDEVSRMKDLEYVLLMMATVEEGGYFVGDKEVERYVKLYDPEYPSKEETVANFRGVLNLIVNCELPADTIWKKRSSFFTLVVELIKFKRSHGSLPSKEALTNTLISLEQRLNDNKREDVGSNQYAQYYYYTHQGTASRKGRFIRGQLLQTHLEQESSV